jgi:hypothetical protein
MVLVGVRKDLRKKINVWEEIDRELKKISMRRKIDSIYPIIFKNVEKKPFPIHNRRPNRNRRGENSK